MTTDTEALIEALESEGPSKELDRQIARLTGWHRVEPRHTRGRHGGWVAPQDWLGANSDGSPILDSLHGTTIHRDVPDFTASVDAALTLVPEGWLVSHLSTGDPTCGVAGRMSVTEIRPHLGNDEGWDIGQQEGRAMTPAIALCIASLKARGES